MNEAGMLRCDALRQRQETAEELRQRLVRMENMSLLCHCSAEIDQGTLLYFSVNDMFLGGGDYLLLLFSVESEPTVEQQEGWDISSRVRMYTLIEEEVAHALQGHHTFYSSELDGRLVVLILFHYGLLPRLRADLVQMIGHHCARVAETCREKYDLPVVVYISEVMDRVAGISSEYHKMLSTATLHRYTHRRVPGGVFHMLRPGGKDASPYLLPVQECARAIANAIVDQGEYHRLITETLDALESNPLQSVDELKARFGELYETLCQQLRLRGVKLDWERLRTQQFQKLTEEYDWRRPVDWLHQMAENAAQVCRENEQRQFKRSLELIQQYIAAHLDDPGLSTESVAEAAEMSYTSLVTVFNRQLRTTPAKYIRKRRLEQAVALMQDTDASIREISHSCGFGSLETFHRVFKEEYGMTPGKLRRLNQAARGE